MLKGKVAVITGAGSHGMGRFSALELAKLGADVAISDINEQGLAETKALIEAQTSAKVYLQKVDVTAYDQLASFAENVEKEFGQCDIVYSNAGVALGGMLQDHDPAKNISFGTDVNFKGVLYTVRAFQNLVNQSENGHIVNCASITAFVPFAGSSVYAATKGGVRQFTDALRIDNFVSGLTNVQCQLVVPGVIATDIINNAKDVADKDAIDEYGKHVATCFGAELAGKVIADGIVNNQEIILIGPDAEELYEARDASIPTKIQLLQKHNILPSA